MSLNETQSEVIANDALAACNQQTRYVNDVPVLVLPEGFQVSNLEKLLAFPARKRGVTNLNDAESFIAVVKDQKLYNQAGGGVVYDSDPEAEYQETVNKASALLVAVARAEEGTL